MGAGSNWRFFRWPNQPRPASSRFRQCQQECRATLRWLLPRPPSSGGIRKRWRHQWRGGYRRRISRSPSRSAQRQCGNKRPARFAHDRSEWPERALIIGRSLKAIGKAMGVAGEEFGAISQRTSQGGVPARITQEARLLGDFSGVRSRACVAARYSRSAASVSPRL